LSNLDYTLASAKRILIPSLTRSLSIEKIQPYTISYNRSGHLLEHSSQKLVTSVATANMSDMSQEDAAIKMSSTPSPTASNSASSTSASRRPPRKSTLTQQQKNQKRQRATQDQLVTLEMEFNKNPTPTATVRERIAEDINMTERSVQIWFQNR
jgi:hypothetical protein